MPKEHELDKRDQEPAGRFVKNFVEGHCEYIKTQNRRILERLAVNKQDGNWAFDENLFPPALFAEMKNFVEQKYIAVFRNITAEDFDRWVADGNGYDAKFLQ